MRKILILITILILMTSQTNFIFAKERKLEEIDNDKFVEIATKQCSCHHAHNEHCGKHHTSAKPQKDNITLYKSNIGRFATLQNKKGDLVGYFLITSDFALPKGYQGPTALGVEIDNDSKIVSAEIIESLDTRTYIRKIDRKGFIKQFLGLSPGEIDVQAVTGATMTSEAIEQSISETLETFEPLKNALVFQSDSVTCTDTTFTVEKIK